MKKTLFSFFLAVGSLNSFAQSNPTESGIITVVSSHSVSETADRFVETATAKGLTVFARIDHGANASKQGLTLRPTQLIIFGNPKVGTTLLQDQQLAGIDLPLRALIWEDEKGKVWLSYYDPQWIAARHGLSAKTAGTAKAMTEGLKAIVINCLN